MNILLLRRDLRLEDNTSLNKLIEKGEKNICLIFIFPKKFNKNYFSEKSFEFLNERLKILSEKVNINFFESDDETQVFEEINKNNNIKNIYINRDITEEELKKDFIIKQWSIKNNINFEWYNDYLLFDPKNILNKSNNEFKTFTPFFNTVKPHLKSIQSKNLITKKINFLIIKNQFSTIVRKINKYFMPITRIEVFSSIEKNIKNNYKDGRDFFEYKTTHISAALRYGVISCREAIEFSMHMSEKAMPFIRQLLWKEFFYHFYFHNIKSYKIRGEKPTNILSKYNDWSFHKNDEWVEMWKRGRTGIDIIDAAMNQMNITGYMHNRSRMIVATFFCKNMNLDWRIGEKYFAEKLIDYDPIVNNQSWQWCSIFGLDYRGQYRTFSPSIQTEKYDKNRKYINKYLIKHNIKNAIDEKESRKIFLSSIKKYNDRFK